MCSLWMQLHGKSGGLCHRSDQENVTEATQSYFGSITGNTVSTNLSSSLHLPLSCPLGDPTRHPAAALTPRGGCTWMLQLTTPAPVCAHGVSHEAADEPAPSLWLFPLSPQPPWSGGSHPHVQGGTPSPQTHKPSSSRAAAVCAPGFCSSLCCGHGNHIPSPGFPAEKSTGLETEGVKYTDVSAFW